MEVNVISQLFKGLFLTPALGGHLQFSLSYGKIVSLIPRSTSIYIVYISVLIMFVYSFISYLKLGKFSFFRTFAFPAVYIIILIVTINYSNVDGDVYTVLAGIPGIFGGILLGGNAFFVRRHSVVMYRRSFFATVVWTLALYVRLSVLFFFPVFAYIIFSSAFLALLTGLILGEALRIYFGHRNLNSLP